MTNGVHFVRLCLKVSSIDLVDHYIEIKKVNFIIDLITDKCERPLREMT